MLGRPTRVLVMLLLIGALAQGYQWVSCRDCGLGDGCSG